MFAVAWMADARFPWRKVVVAGGWITSSVSTSVQQRMYLDANSTIMAIVLLNLNAKYLFVTFGLTFEFGYFY